MDSYKRRIVIERFVSAIDTTGDGNLDSITLLTTDKYVPLILKQSIKDIGVYTDYDDTKEAVEIEADNLWNDYNDGSNDGGTGQTGAGISNPYIDGEVANTAAGGVTIEGCTDPIALNYYVLANVPCNGDNSCCEYGFGGYSGSGGGGGDNLSCNGCHALSSGCVSLDWPAYFLSALNVSIQWCQGTASSCGSYYPITPYCDGNGCGGDPCCPGPIFSKTLASGPPYSFENGTACGQAEKFEGIRLVGSTYNPPGCAGYQHTWHFYCV